MPALSKSKLLAYRQCHKRVWLEVNRRELRQDSEQSKANFEVGYQVGAIARQLYDQKEDGTELDPQRDGFEVAISKTKELLQGRAPIFEATFSTGDALAQADVLLPERSGKGKRWRMVEVKSSASVKDYHREDAAIQTHIALRSGVLLSSVSVAHIDSKWVYPGNEDFNGLLLESDITEEVMGRGSEVQSWIDDAQQIVNAKAEPKISAGAHCEDPFPCGFIGYCSSQEASVEFPVRWLPRVQSKKLKQHLAGPKVKSLDQVPDELLNDIQRRVKTATLNDKVYFDKAAAKAALAGYALPAYFLDFETTNPTVPVWAGTSPFQQIPFQFSCHRLTRTGRLAQSGFLDLSGNDPSRPFADELLRVCGDRGPIFVYNRAFEARIIKSLALQFPRLSKSLLAIVERLVDLLPVAQAHYYHPSQQGSWSIKAVLPAMIPNLSYDKLDGVQDGGAAQSAFAEAIASGTTAARKVKIQQELLDYCRLDTFAMVKLWQVFAGRDDLRIDGDA